MSSGPDDRSTGTIKFGDKFDAPWFVASGNPAQIRRQILEFAGLEDDPTKTLQQIMLEVATETQAMWATRSKLGATQILPGKGKKAEVVEETAAAEPAPAAPAEPEDPNAFIHELLREAATLLDLKRVYAANKAEFTKDKALQATFTERKNALS